MSLEDGTLLQIGVSVGSVLALIALAVAVGQAYGGPESISEEGAFVIIGAIVLFSVVLSAVGLLMGDRWT